MLVGGEGREMRRRQGPYADRMRAAAVLRRQEMQENPHVLTTLPAEFTRQQAPVGRARGRGAAVPGSGQQEVTQEEDEQRERVLNKLGWRGRYQTSLRGWIQRCQVLESVLGCM